MTGETTTISATSLGHQGSEGSLDLENYNIMTYLVDDPSKVGTLFGRGGEDNSRDGQVRRPGQLLLQSPLALHPHPIIDRARVNPLGHLRVTISEQPHRSVRITPCTNLRLSHEGQWRPWQSPGGRTLSGG